jgi:hypothetical protein
MCFFAPKMSAARMAETVPSWKLPNPSTFLLLLLLLLLLTPPLLLLLAPISERLPHMAGGPDAQHHRGGAHHPVRRRGAQRIA